MGKRVGGPPGNEQRKCYGPFCPKKDRPLKKFNGKSRYWKMTPPHFGYRGNNYFCSLQCGMDWAVLKCDAGGED